MGKNCSDTLTILITDTEITVFVLDVNFYVNVELPYNVILHVTNSDTCQLESGNLYFRLFDSLGKHVIITRRRKMVWIWLSASNQEKQPAKLSKHQTNV